MHSHSQGSPERRAIGQTATYCSECYNKVARMEDDTVKATERKSKGSYDETGTCGRGSQAGTVIYYE